jgi:hypothetical protein
MSHKRRITSFLLTDVSHRARIVKLKAEISLIDHELETLQCQFGMAFYDAIEQESTSMNNDWPEPIATAYQECKTLIDSKRSEQTKRHDAMDAHMSQRLRSSAPTNITERAKSLADAVTSRSVDAKYKLENMWFDREMIREKQVFGRLVFDSVLELANQSNAIEQESLQLIVDDIAEKAADPLQRKAEKWLQIAALEAVLEQSWPKDNHNNDDALTKSSEPTPVPTTTTTVEPVDGVLSDEQ